MVDLYKKAYKEVYEVLQHIPEEDLKKVPKDILKVIEVNMDKEYHYKLDENKSFEEQPLLNETKALLAIIYRNYWATPEQRERILLKEKYDLKIHEEELRKKYNPDNIFKNKHIQKEEQSLQKHTELIEYKEQKWYQKLFAKILNIFKKQP